MSAISSFNKNMLFVSVMAVSFLFAGRCYCQDAVLELSLEKTIEMAIDSSEAVKIRENDISKSKAVYRETRSAVLPHVNGSASWEDNLNYPVSAAGQIRDYGLTAGVTASQLLWSFGSVMTAVNAAKKAVDASKFSRDASIQEIVYIAKLSYYSALLAENTLKIAEASYDNSIKNKDILEKRSYGGRSSRGDRIRMDADIAARMPTVNNARAQFMSALQTLHTVTDVSPKTDIVLIDSCAESCGDMDRGALEAALMENEPSLKALDKTIESAEDMVWSRRLAYLPTVSAFASWNKNGDSDDHWYVGENAFKDYSMVGVKVDVPFWNGGEKEAKLSRAMTDKNNAVLSRQQLEKNLLLELRNALSDYEEYIKTLAANNEAVTLAEESFKIIQEMFEAGQSNLTDLNDAEILLTNQRLRREITMFNIRVTRARVEKLTLRECL